MGTDTGCVCATGVRAPGALAWPDPALSKEQVSVHKGTENSSGSAERGVPSAEGAGGTLPPPHGQVPRVWACLPHSGVLGAAGVTIVAGTAVTCFVGLGVQAPL